MFDEDQKAKGRRIPISDGAEPPVTEDDGAAAAGAESAGADSTAEGLLADLEAELAEAKEAHLRAVADLQNFRRRSSEERTQQMQFANEQLVLEILPVLDNFERATGCEVDGDAAQNLLRGVCMVQQQLADVLVRFGVERVATEGQQFDPARHEAVERVETREVAEGTIVGEVLPGYALHGRVIRAAKVRVAAPPH